MSAKLVSTALSEVCGGPEGLRGAWYVSTYTLAITVSMPRHAYDERS